MVHERYICTVLQQCNSTLTYRFTYVESFRRPQQYDWTSKASKRDENFYTNLNFPSRLRILLIFLVKLKHIGETEV